MACDVLLIVTLSTLRVDRGFISPSVETAQLTGFLEQAGIGFDILSAVARDDGRNDIMHDNKPAAGLFEDKRRELSPRIVFLYHYPEFVHLVFAVHEAARTGLPADALFREGWRETRSVRPDSLSFDWQRRDTAGPGTRPWR